MTVRIFWLLVVLGVPAVVLLLDWALYNLAGNDATLSRMLLNVQSRWPILAFGIVFDMGVLVGHLFLYQTIATK